MKNLVKAWNRLSIVQRIIIGLIVGLILYFIFPQELTFISIFGQFFVLALRAVAPVLVFIIVASAVANHQSGKRSNLGRIIILYLIGTFFASLIAVIMSFIFPVSISLVSNDSDLSAAGSIHEVLKNLVLSIFKNPVDALLNVNFIGILVWGIFLGLGLRKSASSSKNFLADLAEALSFIIKIVMQIAPLGVMGLIYQALTENGLAALADYGQLLCVLVACYLIITLVLNPLIVWFNIRQNPYPLVFRCLRESGITAFFMRSSAANIPVNMMLCQNMGLAKETYSVSIPLGATINMAGAAVTIPVLALAAVHTLGIHVDIFTALLLAFVSALAACGASGVPGGSLLLIPLATSLFGIPNDVGMQVVGVGFIISFLEDSLETALNSHSDALFTISAEFNVWKKQGKSLPPV